VPKPLPAPPACELGGVWAEAWVFVIRCRGDLDREGVTAHTRLVEVPGV